MVVILQNHLTLRAESLSFRPREENFTAALIGMRVPKRLVNNSVIIIEIRDMIPQAGYGGRNKNAFRIVLRKDLLLYNNTETNKAVAHELKHLATQILKPPKPENLKYVDGFYVKRKSYKWEEVNCKRAEKRWGTLDYFVSTLLF